MLTVSIRVESPLCFVVSTRVESPLCFTVSTGVESPLGFTVNTGLKLRLLSPLRRPKLMQSTSFCIEHKVEVSFPPQSFLLYTQQVVIGIESSTK